MDSRMNASGQPPGRPRIGIDATILRPKMSGVERSVYSLIQALSEIDAPFDFIIYQAPALPKPAERTTSHLRYKHPLLPTTLRTSRILWDQAMLPLALRRDKAALLHSPAYIAPRFCGTPYVLTIYDLIALKFPRLCKRSNVLHYRLLMPAAARRATRIIVPSECTRRDVIKLLGVSDTKIRVIPLGVSEQFRPIEDRNRIAEMRQRHGLPESYLLYVGNLEPKKNLPHLLRAFAAARRSGRVTQRLVIAGCKAWHTRELHRTLRQCRLQNSVILTGEIPERDLPALYSGAALFIFPSLYEGFGLPPLEAMACGTPVITTHAGALPEVVGNAALLLSTGDTRELRVAIEKVLTNTFLRTRLRAEGLKRAKHFTWQNTAAQTLKVYAEALEENRQ